LDPAEDFRDRPLRDRARRGRAASPGGIPIATGGIGNGLTRYSGRVTDAATGLGIAGVCVYAGPPMGCPSPNLNTDATGYWAMDFPTGFSVTWNFQHPAYVSVLGTKLTSVQMHH